MTPNSTKSGDVGYPGGNTPCSISDGEITPTSVESVRDMTRAFPDDTNVSGPRCYDQCIEGPNLGTDGGCDNPMGLEPTGDVYN